jgi:probable phosphoglycerate mutase
MGADRAGGGIRRQFRKTMKLYFIRHGESEANIQHVISNYGSHYGLTEHGKQQVQVLAERLKETPLTTMYSSPVLRAMDTADILYQALDLPYRVTEALREYHCGILEGKSDEESWRLHRKYYEDWTLRHDYTSKPDGGESFVDIQNRFVPFIESLKRNDDDEHILLVGHGGLFHLMLPLILTNIDNDFSNTHSIGHTEIIVAELHTNGFVCLQWGDIQF